MTDLEKARFILNLLAKQKLELDGAKEAFSFTQAYKWLVQVAKDMETYSKGDSNANS